MSTRGTVLLYRSTCAKCRALSLAVVWMSLGWVRRVPLSSAEGLALCTEYSIPPRKVALIGDRHVFTGWRAVTALPGVVAGAFRVRRGDW